MLNGCKMWIIMLKYHHLYFIGLSGTILERTFLFAALRWARFFGRITTVVKFKPKMLCKLFKTVC